MTYSDREKLKRLRETFDRNYRVSRLYADYLSIYPEFLNKEMIDAICEGSDITDREAIYALLCQLFGFDDEKAEDRRIMREYLLPSIRVFDAKKYEENPYCKKIAPEPRRLGAWEIKWERYPAYRAAICDDIILSPDCSEIFPLGFFRDGLSFPAVLEDGNEWMTLTPVDVDTSEDAINRAHGRVVTFGLGLGYYTYMASMKDEVESVTVVERSEDIIRLFKELILPKFEHKEKIRIVNSDAFEYAEKIMPGEEFDFAFVDTWRDASDGAPMYERMKALEHLSPNTEFTYWIENFLVSRLRSLKFEELWEKYEGASEDAPKSYAEFIERLGYGRDT